MKLLIVPTLLAIVAVAQIVRIEQVIADEPPIAAAKSAAASALQHSGPPLSQEQMDFDRLAKEFEEFARVDYVIEPPDILKIEGVKLVPKSPHRLETFDVLLLRVKGALPEQPIDNAYNVDADGSVNLGPTYGRIEVVGQTIEEAEDSILAQLFKVLTDVDVSVSLHASSSAQAITGQHLVAMDGRVNLGAYGFVYVAGMTLKEARAAIELKLAEHLDDPKVFVEVLANNSKVVYLILEDDHGRGDVTRKPLPYPFRSQVNVGSILKDATYPNPIDFAAAKISIARPAPNGVDVELKLPVTWDAARGEPTATTNYPLLPGDRIFVTTLEEHSPQAVSSTPVADPAPSPVVPAIAVDESNFDKRAQHSKNAVVLTLAVIEDSTDSLTEFRTGRAKGDLIVGDGKTLGAALRILEKNSLVKIVDRELIACSLVDGDRLDAELPLPNPTLRLKPTQTEPTQVSVRRLGKDGYAVKLEFRRMVDGAKERQSIEFAMRLGDVNVHECNNATADGKSYLLIQLAAEDNQNASNEPSQAAAPMSESLAKGQAGHEFQLEPRFVPTIRNSKKSKPTNAEESGAGGGIKSEPSKPRAASDSSYRLRPYDTIKLHVERPHRPVHALTWGDLEGEFTLSHDGSIYLGDDLELVQLAGMTSEEACSAIERELREATPECKVTLELGPLASEKYFVSIQRPDGTEVAAGALPVDASAPASMNLGSLRHWLGTAFEEADWELAEPSDSNGRKAYLPGPGDRLVIKVRADAELGLLESPPSRPNYRVVVPPPMWIEVFGKKIRGFRIAPLPGWRALYSSQFDHPDIQRPAGPKYAR